MATFVVLRHTAAILVTDFNNPDTLTNVLLILKSKRNTVLCTIKVNSNTIELIAHNSCYCVKYLLRVNCS